MRKQQENLVLSSAVSSYRRFFKFLGEGFLFLITSVAAISVLLIIFFIAKDAIPFFTITGWGGVRQFFGDTHWYPSGTPPVFGAGALFMGSALVTLGAALVAVPLGVSAAVCLSDVLPFSIRQFVKPIIEILAAIPSVAYGFFALVVFAPLLQRDGGHVLAVAWWCIALPFFLILVIVLSDLLSTRVSSESARKMVRIILVVLMAGAAGWILFRAGGFFNRLQIDSGANALNVSIVLGIMALPTIVSVSEDALQAVGRELREGSYALGATRAETMVRTIIPAASSGMAAAVLLGIMRALGETMVVWMASGNAAQIPKPWFDFTDPVRTLTATIAGDMGEADHVTGSERYHVLFAIGLCLLLFCFVCNLASEWIVSRQRRKLSGEEG